jgi:hypothetical protein
MRRTWTSQHWSAEPICPANAAEQRMLRGVFEPIPPRLSALEARFSALEARMMGIEESINGIGLALRQQTELLLKLQDQSPGGQDARHDAPAWHP